MVDSKQRQQSERAGIDPTLSVVVAEGFALGQVVKQPPCQVSNTEPYDKRKPLVNGFLGFSKLNFWQTILNLSFRSKIGAKPLLLYITKFITKTWLTLISSKCNIQTWSYSAHLAIYVGGFSRGYIGSPLLLLQTPLMFLRDWGYA